MEFLDNRCRHENHLNKAQKSHQPFSKVIWFERKSCNKVLNLSRISVFTILFGSSSGSGEIVYPEWKRIVPPTCITIDLVS